MGGGPPDRTADAAWVDTSFCSFLATRWPRSGALSDLQPGIERVPQAVSHEVEGHDRQEHAETGEERHPPGDAQVLAAVGDDVPPTGARRLHAQPEEAESGPREDGEADAQCGGNGDHGD